MTILTDMMVPQADVTPASLLQYVPSSGSISDITTVAGCVTLVTVHTSDVAAGRSKIASN